MTVLVNPLPALEVIQIVDTEDGNFVLLPREEWASFLKAWWVAVAMTIPESAPDGGSVTSISSGADQFSRKVPPALELIQGEAS